MNNYYLLKPFVRNTFNNKDAYQVFFKYYFYSKLKESSLPPHTIFVRADVFSDKTYKDFSVSRVKTNIVLPSENEIHNILEKNILAIRREDISTQAEVILTFIIKIGEKYCLTDENLNVISHYYELAEPTYLYNNFFRTPAEQRFIELYDGDEFPIDNTTFNHSYPKLRKIYYLSQDYIIRKNDCYGIVNCKGQYIVPAKYDRIKPFSINKEHSYDIAISNSFFESLYANVALYVCKRNAEYKYDVYDINGNLIFEQVDDLSPCEETVFHSQFDSEFETHTEKIEVKSIYVGKFYETELINSIEDEEYEEYLPIDKSFKYNIDDLQSKVKNTESNQEPEQKNIANFNSGFNYMSESCYEDILNAPKRFLDIIVMMAETILRVQKFSLEMWLETDFIFALEECSRLQKMKLCEIFSLDISELNFTVRTFNCLKRAGINTVEELLKLNDEAMMNVRNLGKKGYKEATTMKNVIKWKIENPLT